MTVIALLQVDANLLGGLHLELVQGLTGAGNHGLVGIGIVRARHNSASPLVTNLLDSVNPDIALPQGGFLCAPFFAGRVCEKRGIIIQIDKIEVNCVGLERTSEIEIKRER